MNDKQKVGVAIVATAIAVGGGGALAAGHGSSAGSAGNGTVRNGSTALFAARSVDHGPLAAAATYLGLTRDQLRAQLDAGKTLAQVAQAQGKSVSGLEDALLADMKSHLDDAVAAGKLTSAQESQILADAKTRIAQMVTTAPPARPESDLMAAAAQYLGLTDAQLRTQLESGKSLADVAKAQGKSVSGLEDALTTAFKSHLDTFVNAKHTGRPGFGPGGAGPGFGPRGGAPGFGFHHFRR